MSPLRRQALELMSPQGRQALQLIGAAQLIFWHKFDLCSPLHVIHAPVLHQLWCETKILFQRNFYSDNVDKHSSEEEHAVATIASLVRGWLACWLVGLLGTLTSSVWSLFPVCCYWKVWKPEIRGELGGKSVNPQDHSALQWLKSFLLCQTSKTFINQPGGMGWFCEKEKAKCAKRSSCFPHIFWSKCKICPIGIRVFSAPFCLAVGVSRTDSSTDTSRVASSVDVSEGHDGGEVAEGVVGAAGSGDTSGVHCCFPLANVVGKLTLVSNLGSPPKNIYWNWKSTQLTLRGGNVGAI